MYISVAVVSAMMVSLCYYLGLLGHPHVSVYFKPLMEGFQCLSNGRMTQELLVRLSLSKGILIIYTT